MAARKTTAQGALVNRLMRGWSGRWLLIAALLAVFASPAHAQDCSDYPNGVLDGATGTVAPSQLQIDTNCTIRNYPASNPLRTNFSFLTQPGQTNERWLIIFDNVVHTGQMACNSVAGHKIWFTNGSSTTIQEGCQNLLIPVEKIDKGTDTGQTTATVGVPFTYRLTMPVLFDPGTEVVINVAGSVNDLHGVTVIDDLNETGVDLTYISHVAYDSATGASIPHTFTNVGGVLTFDNFPIIPAGDQIIVDITVVLEDTPTNTVGTQFINTARWDFGRLIDGVFYEPLPGEWGISPPLTIGGPVLTTNKSGPATLSFAQAGDFVWDVQNTGSSDAFDVTILDRIPDGPSGGMCDATPVVQSARVFAADGVTPVPGKGPLSAGSDYALSYSGAPTCEFTLTTLSAAAVIGPGERLIVTYQAQLDTDTLHGVTLTNVAGATQWFNGDASVTARQAYTRVLTDGTVGTVDHEDAHSVDVLLTGNFFEKTVANLTSGTSPAILAAPGDVLRYTLRVRSTDSPLNNVTIRDDLGALNSGQVFVPGSLRLVPGSLPPGADASGTNPAGGTNGAGILDVGNLNLPVNGQAELQFDITLESALLDATVVLNQADLIDTVKIADSDDPNINGVADPGVPGDEDPTRVVIQAAPPNALLKANTQGTAAIGESFRYRISVPATPHSAPLYDVRVIDNLVASAADLEYVDVAYVAGPASWTPVNTGSATNLVIEDSGGGIDVPVGEQAVMDITVRLRNTPTNVAGLTFTNTAAYTYNQLDNDTSTQLTGSAGTTQPMTVVEPELTLEKTGPAQMRAGVAGTFVLNLHNTGDSPAHGVYVTDQLPNIATGGMCDTAPTQVSVQLFEADAVTQVAPPLVQGTDYRLTFTGDPTCTFDIELLTDTAVIGADQRLLIAYDTVLDAGTQEDALLSNIAGATRWFSTDVSVANPESREYARVVTDGTPTVLDHEDVYTVMVNQPILIFEKTVANLTRGDDPASLATPGERLRYSLRVENASDRPLDDFSIVDELDRLNATAAFQAGTLNVVTVPNGADSAATDAAGGSAGTGLLDVRNLSLAGLGDSLLIEFEVDLAPVIANDSFVYNQSEVRVAGQAITVSDDPNVNGAADPNVNGDEDPTQIRIESAPAFDIDKISSYVTGDPSVLLAGETLRYTVTVRNIGTDHATGVELRDQIPANTTYVAASTTLNGVAVADAPGGGSPLTNGTLINAPQDGTPGVLNAGVADNTATIVFDVVVYPDAPDGTIISNQAFVDAVDNGVADQPSDDPRTPIVDDPTRDVVGNFPLLFAPKSAALAVDLGSPGIVDPGDVLRYTITIYNNGTIPATAVGLADMVPADTTYVADSVTLNGISVGVPDAGVFPLIARIPMSSADLTPPLPNAGEGMLNPGESAVVQFDLQVNAGVAPGTLITNQAIVYTEELPNLLTDGDGNPATGPEPTVVVVGDAQQLSIVKEVAVVNGGAALPGATLEYAVTVRNVGSVPAQYVVITDDLDAVNPGYITYVDQSATLNGLTDGVSFAGTTITADYSTDNGALDPDETITLRFRAIINPALATGTRIINTGRVTWNDPAQWAEASVSIDVGAVPEAGMLSGNVWHDADHDDNLDGVERLLEGWTVELLRDDRPIRSTVTDVDGYFLFSGVPPNYLTTEMYSLRFSAAGAGSRTALMGETESDFTDGQQRIDEIEVLAGSNLLNLNMPVDPNGVIYNSISRAPVPGATVFLLDIRNGARLPSDCFYDPNHQGQVTVGNGYYKFGMTFNDPACPPGSNYLIEVIAPDSTYIPGVSEIIPPTSDQNSFAFDVPACPGSANDAVLATNNHCEAQPSEFPPARAVPARSPATAHHLFLRLDDGGIPGSAQLFNNHIPLDPRLDGAVAVSKTTPMLNVSRGQLIPYVITVSNSFGLDLQDVNVVDRFPAGFRYVEGSARFDGVKTEPALVGRELIWSNLSLAVDGRHEIKLLLAAGAGVSEGEFVNRAQAVNAITGGIMSEEASATVRLVPDPTMDCTDVTGRVFEDNNRNGLSDPGEQGLAGVRVVTVTGLAAKTDKYGRYHITCAIVPNENRGSNFVLKLDDRTLPSGFRSSVQATQVRRATRGKALRINFGASIHRVVGLDLADAVFEPGTADMRPQWRPRIGMLMNELQKQPVLLRLSYVADLEPAALVDRRLKGLKAEIMGAWKDLNCCYELVIETEIFWRLGGPADKPRSMRE